MLVASSQQETSTLLAPSILTISFTSPSLTLRTEQQNALENKLRSGNVSPFANDFPIAPPNNNFPPIGQLVVFGDSQGD